MKNIIIGSGPAGRLAGLELGKLGEEAILIEKKYIAGNCLNEGCMVICALNDVARFLNNKKRFEELGFLKGNIEISYLDIVNKIHETQKMIRKIHQEENESVNNQIIYGEAKVNNNEVTVNGESFNYDKLLIATGGRPFIPKIKGFEHGLTSKDILKLKKVPEKLNIIGGGHIASELAGLFSSFGSEVNLIVRGEMLEGLDKDLRKYIINKILKNVKIHENQEILEVKKDKLEVSNGKFEGSTLFATGRLPNSKIVEDLVDLDQKKHIKVNKLMETSKKNIYAAGDVIGGINLTTIARMEGIIAARNMAGYSSVFNYKNIPQSFALDMDIGYAIKTNKNQGEKQIDKEETKTISMPGAGGPGSFWRVLNKDTGFSKISYNPKTGNITGAYSISPSAVSDIAFIAYLMENNLEDFAEDFIEIHPTTNIFHHLIEKI
ncbi:FAD-dependent oxidoreductase [Methanobrevibacter filiformis]|nr:NAD(P)/FAD-dependent oxidoreductase [Methanobrevibacter filiformis]